MRDCAYIDASILYTCPRLPEPPLCEFIFPHRANRTMAAVRKLTAIYSTVYPLSAPKEQLSSCCHPFPRVMISRSLSRSLGFILVAVLILILLCSSFTGKDWRPMTPISTDSHLNFNQIPHKIWQIFLGYSPFDRLGESIQSWVKKNPDSLTFWWAMTEPTASSKSITRIDRKSQKPFWIQVSPFLAPIFYDICFLKQKGEYRAIWIPCGRRVGWSNGSKFQASHHRELPDQGTRGNTPSSWGIMESRSSHKPHPSWISLRRKGL